MQPNKPNSPAQILDLHNELIGHPYEISAGGSTNGLREEAGNFGYEAAESPDDGLNLVCNYYPAGNAKHVQSSTLVDQLIFTVDTEMAVDVMVTEDDAFVWSPHVYGQRAPLTEEGQRAFYDVIDWDEFVITGTDDGRSVGFDLDV